MQFHCILSGINTWEIGPSAGETYTTYRFPKFSRGGADVIGRRKPLGHPQAKISTYICKVAMESRKKRKKFPGTERLEGTKKTTNQLVKAAKIPSYLLNGTNALNKP